MRLASRLWSPWVQWAAQTAVLSAGARCWQPCCSAAGVAASNAANAIEAAGCPASANCDHSNAKIVKIAMRLRKR